MNNLKYKVYEYLGTGQRTRKANLTSYLVVGVIILNVVFIILESENSVSQNNTQLLSIVRVLFLIFFILEYLLRLWIADLGFRGVNHPIKSRVRFALSIDGILSLFAILPVMVTGINLDFRIFRILRLFKVLRIKMLDEYKTVLYHVFKEKSKLLVSAFFMVLIFVLIAAILMYNIEHEAQPQAFGSIVSSLWWSVITITTVGYGDVYPITATGKTIGAIISLSGIFIMAIPIGIISSGFFEMAKTIKK